MKIFQYSKFFFVISALLVLASLMSIASFGLKLGIEFTGGSILEVAYIQESPAVESNRAQKGDLDIG